MAAILSPLQLQAGSALFQNQGIEISSTLTTEIADYKSLPLLANLIATINASNALPTSTQTLLQTFAGNSCPALADSIVSGTVSSVSTTLTNSGMSGIITLTAENYFGFGDLSKFAQTFNAAVSYAETTNIFINSAVNASTYLADTFTSMNSLTTGGLTDVNLATKAMGDDLSNAGYWINLADLANLGTPLALIQQISQRAGTISPLIGALADAGINENIILNLSDTDLIVTDDVQRVMYTTLTKITGSALEQMLQILDIWTPNINTLADLLNPAVMLPNSYASLTTSTVDGLRGIYITEAPVAPFRTLEEEAESRVVDRPLACEIRQSDTLGSARSNSNTGSGTFYTVNSNLEPILPPFGISLDRLSIITDPGLALANKAFANALLQITNVGRMTLPQLAEAFLTAATNNDLPDINAQTQAVPQTDLDYYSNTMATGTGDNGTILITDILGTATGINITDNLSNSISVINSLYEAGELDDLITIYDDMLGNVASDSAILSLIGNALSEIANVISANPTETTNLNTYFSAMSTQITNETTFQNTAGLDVAGTTSSQTSTQSFVFSLPSYGVDTKVGGSAQYLESVADVSTAGGQAIVAVLREGRSRLGLNATGVGTASNSVSADPAEIPPQANLIPSVVSESSARANIVY